MSDVTMRSIGEKLKAAREAKGLTISQVQKETLIHSSVVEALEEGRCDKMLTATYVKSFLKKYASHLGLDVAQIMAEYGAASPEARSAEQTAARPQAAGESTRPPFDPALLLRAAKPVVMAVVALALVFFLGSKLVGCVKGLRRPRVVVAGGAKATRAAAKTTATKAAPAKTAAVARNAAAEEKALNLVLTTKRGVFVSARVDGILVFNKHLPKGTVENLRADLSINLYIGRGDAVELVLNGKRVTNIGRGLVKDLEITRKGVRLKP